jgi:hypothetical protein
MPFVFSRLKYSLRRKGVEAMRHSAKATEKWRYRAIFINFQKTKVTVLDEGKESCRRGKVPESFLKKSSSNMKHPEKVALRRLSIAELLCGTFTIFCFVIYVYVKMFSFETKNEEAISQLETYAVISLVIGITFLVTLMTSMIFRRLFPGEMQ